MVCAAAEMVCATRQNDVRSWQNGVRAISDGTDVLGKMVCALMCALLCAPMAGVPVAQRISFSSDERYAYTKYYRPAPLRGGQGLGPTADINHRGRRFLINGGFRRKTWETVREEVCVCVGAVQSI